MQSPSLFSSVSQIVVRWVLALTIASTVLFQFWDFFHKETDFIFHAQTAAPRPFFEGWYENGDGRTCSLNFGYANENSRSVSVPIGGNNFFRPSPQNQGQPTR